MGLYQRRDSRFWWMSYAWKGEQYFEPDAVVQRAMGHSSPETKRRYQLGMVEQMRRNLGRANEKVYGKGQVLRFHDAQPAAEAEQEMAIC